MNDIDIRFSHITHSDGQQFQVLKYDEQGNPIDWDEVATALEYKNYLEGP